MKVSILIPTYNQAGYVREAVWSAIQQDYPDKEIIIADDHSTDNTFEIVKDFLNGSNPVSYFRNDTNIGRVNNYRKALYEYATGNYVILLDGDDYFCDHGYISEAVSRLKKHPDTVLVFARIKTFYQQDRSLVYDKVNRLKPVFDGNFLFLNFWKGYSIPHQTSLYKRDLAIQSGYYTEDILSTDWESVLRLIIDNKVQFIDKYVAVWRKHSANASRSIDKHSVLSNLKFIDNVFNYAIDYESFTEKQLEFWKFKMLKRYFFRILVQVSFMAPEQLAETRQWIRDYSPEIYRAMRFDFKYMSFRIIKNCRPFLYFVTKYIIKQESLLKDIELYKKKEC